VIKGKGEEEEDHRRGRREGKKKIDPITSHQLIEPVCVAKLREREREHCAGTSIMSTLLYCTNE